MKKLKEDEKKKKRKANLEDIKESNNVWVVDGGQECEPAVQAVLEVPIELREVDLLHCHYLAAEPLLGLPNYGERPFSEF